MSSTTETHESGQALVIFAGAIAMLLLVGALAFDVGTALVERRHEQDAADAAALAGARCLPDAGCARSRAAETATLNGYSNGLGGMTVAIGASSTRVQVTVGNTLPSIFAGVAGIFNWNVDAVAVAIKQTDMPPNGALVALSPHDCNAVKVTGTGVVQTAGDVQVNSDCGVSPGALDVAGGGTLSLLNNDLGCFVVGVSRIAGKGNGTLCDPPQAGVPIPFTVQGMPTNTSTPANILQVSSTSMSVPSGCPGAGTGAIATPTPSPTPVSTATPNPGGGGKASATPGASATPKLSASGCTFNATYSGTTWRLYPGYYPGGIHLQAGTYYFEPGIYELAGGGMSIQGTGPDSVTAISVAAGGTTFGGGVLFFNTTSSINPDGISLNGSTGQVQFYPLGYNPSCSGPSTGWNGYLVFQDPAVDKTMTIQGGSNEMDARGLIYLPNASITVNGGTGTLYLDALIAYTMTINGNGGNINILYNPCSLPSFSAYGLVI